MKWRILTEEEQAHYAIERECQEAEEREHARLVGECQQLHGHEWVLDLPEPAEDYNGVELQCLRCPATVNDVYMDGFDMIYLEHGDVLVQAGCHNSPEPMCIPVTVDVVSSKIWTDYGWEYDAELIIEVRQGANVTEPDTTLPTFMRGNDIIDRLATDPLIADNIAAADEQVASLVLDPSRDTCATLRLV